MSNSNFDKNGVDKYGTHWLQYAAFVVTAFAVYFGWAFLNDASFHHFALKILKLNAKKINGAIFLISFSRKAAY